MLNRKMIIKFLLASFKTLPNSKDCSESCFRILFWLSFSSIGRYSPVYLSWLAFGTIFMIAGGFRNFFLDHSYRRLSEAGTNFLKRVTGWIFTISKLFHGSKQKLLFWFSSQKREPKMLKTSSAALKNKKYMYWIDFLGSSKKYSSHDTIPLIFVHSYVFYTIISYSST